MGSGLIPFPHLTLKEQLERTGRGGEGKEEERERERERGRERKRGRHEPR